MTRLALARCGGPGFFSLSSKPHLFARSSLRKRKVALPTNVTLNQRDATTLQRNVIEIDERVKLSFWAA